MKYVHNKFSLTMKYAIKQGLLIKNPCVGVVINKLREARKIQVLSVKDQKKLVDYCYKDSFNYLFIFLLGTGLRIGEALGLTWDCVDMEKRTISIKKIMVEIKENPKFSDSPKIVSQMLGHKSIVTTLNTYSHVLKETPKEHIVKIDDFV